MFYTIYFDFETVSGKLQLDEEGCIEVDDHISLNLLKSNIYGLEEKVQASLQAYIPEKIRVLKITRIQYGTGGNPVIDSYN